MADRGISEALGFVLVFALVTSTIGLVYATGLGGLQSAQQAEKVDNVERAFDVLADNVEDIYLGGAPSRATEVKLAGGSIRTGEPVTIEVSARNSADPMDNVSYTVNPEPIVYEDDGGTAIVYTSGAVIRAQESGAVMLAPPRWVNRTDRSVVPLVGTYGSGGISGDGTVLVVTQRSSRSVRGPFEVPAGDTVLVNVTVTSPRVEVWKRYFEDQGYAPIDPDVAGGDVTYQFRTDSLYVTRTSVEVSIGR